MNVTFLAPNSFQTHKNDNKAFIRTEEDSLDERRVRLELDTIQKIILKLNF